MTSVVWLGYSSPLWKLASSFLRIFEAELVIVLARLGPVFADLHEQKEVHVAVEHLFEVCARGGADLLDRPAALAERNRLLPFALNIDRLVDLYRTVLAFLPFLGPHGRCIRQFVVQPSKDFLAGNLSSKEPQRDVGGLVCGVEPRALRYAANAPRHDVGKSVAVQRRDHEGGVELARLIQLFRERQQRR